ncbi:MAG TPA: hypothetical protein VGG62_00865 [Terracidiphilus sp.]
MEQLSDGRLERIELASAIAVSRFRSRRIQIFCDGTPADPELPRNLAQRPLLHPVEAMKFADLVRREHRLILFIWVCPPPDQKDVLFKMRAEGQSRPQVAEK